MKTAFMEESVQVGDLEPMRVWHVGASPHLKEVNGVNAVIWVTAREQALLGNTVTLLLSGQPDEDAQMFADQSGMRLVHVPVRSWRFDRKLLGELLEAERPHVVHMHSVFVPHQAMLALDLVRAGVPYVITPHGGVLPQIFQRGLWKKRLYSAFIERKRFEAASAITYLTPTERRSIENFVPERAGILREVANPVTTEDMRKIRWKGDLAARRFVYLGRFDVLWKGIDILVETARLLPDAQFDLYGAKDEKSRQWLARLRQDQPPNVTFHGPVYGPAKYEVLAEASMYIQTSRWEAFGIAVSESMYIGTPCAISCNMDLAAVLRQLDLCLVLPNDPRESALRLAEALDQPATLQRWSERAQAYAQSNFESRLIAQHYLELYDRLIA